MTAERVFIDTNILLYAHDATAGDKWKKASAIVSSAWDRDELPFISVQVLHELFANVIRRTTNNGRDAEKLIRIYGSWNIVQNSVDVLFDAVAIRRRYKTSFWDSLIIAAAEAAECDLLWTEDLSNGQYYGRVKVINPLTLATK